MMVSGVRAGRAAVIIAFSMLIFSAADLFAYSWPVDEPVVISTFGERRWGNYGRGIEVSGSSGEVHPSAAGELVFYFEDDDAVSRMPSGLGSFAVVEHERKLRTLYGGLELDESIGDKGPVGEDSLLGLAGQSGQTVDPHIYFAVIDSEFEQYVNPLLLLNSVIDNKKPVIRDVGLDTPAGYRSIGRNFVAKAGRTEIIAEIFDPCMSDEFFRPMSPYKIYLFHNGEEVFYLSFESIITAENRSVVQSASELHFGDFYKADGRISLGEINLAPGESRFEVLVSDYAGNESSRVFKIRVVE